MLNIIIEINNANNVSIAINTFSDSCNLSINTWYGISSTFSDTCASYINIMSNTSNTISKFIYSWLDSNINTSDYKDFFVSKKIPYKPYTIVSDNSISFSTCEFRSMRQPNYTWDTYVSVIRRVGMNAIHFAYLALIYMLLYYFNMFFRNSGSLTARAISNNLILWLWTVLGNIGFISLGAFFDFFSLRFRVRKIIVYNKAITRILLGLLYLFNIIAAVFSSNGLYYLVKTNLWNYENRRLALMIATFCSTFISGSLWLFFRNPPIDRDYDPLHSMVRSIFEAIGFNSIAFATYIVWEFWILLRDYQLLGLCIGIPIHLIASGIAIYLETYNFRPMYYGIFYVISFTFVAISTNSIFVYVENITSNAVIYHIIVTAGAGIFTSIFTPNVYRATNRPSSEIELANLNRRLESGMASDNNLNASNNRTDNRILYIIRATIFYYLLVLSFVINTGILWAFMIG